MTRRLTTALLAVFTLLGASGPVARAHDGHDHKVMGTITMAMADHVMLKTTEGKDVTVQVTKDTKVTRNKQPMKVEDIAVGTRVVVTASSEKDVMTAKTIQVAAQAKSAAK
jgi:hypothetical protein